VVDDDAAVLDVIACMLEDLGCEVVCAHGGDEALEILSRQQNVSILITDINVPGMDDYELAERATRIRPTLKVLQLSGREGDVMGSRCSGSRSLKRTSPA
jgi:two-component system, cell cycle response regulator CpdR